MATNNKPRIVDIIHSKNIYIGDAQAPVTLVMFGDYECEACAKANELVKKLLVAFEGKLKFNFRHFPLTRVHQRAMKAAEAAVAAAQVGKFAEMHEMLFQNRRNLGVTSLKLYSREVGIANKRFLDMLVNGVYGWEVRSDLLEGVDRGVRVVPAFFINDQRYNGPLRLAEMRKGVEQALGGENAEKKIA